MNKKPRVVIIAGASGTIGKAIAEHFASTGDRVVGFGLNKDRLHALAKVDDGAIEAIRLDVTDPKAVQTAVSDAADEYGGIDILINAAGIMSPVTTTMPYQEAARTWDEVLAVNLTSSFLLVEAAAPFLAKPHGRIVFIGSASAYTGSGRPGGMAYAAAKAGLSGLVFALAKELGPQGITVNAVVPGLVPDTGITAGYPPEIIKTLSGQIPVGRAGTPADIVAAIAYLTSLEAAYVTGQFLHVNGGLVLGRS